MRKLASLLVLAVFLPAYAGSLTANEAKNHVGEDATVCGLVVDVHFASGSKGTPTFINLEKAFPNQIFTVLIWGDDLPNFTENPVKWQGKKLCATGTIASYKGIPEIVAKSKSKITVTEAKSK